MDRSKHTRTVAVAATFPILPGRGTTRPSSLPNSDHHPQAVPGDAITIRGKLCTNGGAASEELALVRTMYRPAFMYLLVLETL